MLKRSSQNRETLPRAWSICIFRNDLLANATRYLRCVMVSILKLNLKLELNATKL